MGESQRRHADVHRERVLNSWVDDFDTASFLDTVAAEVRSEDQVVVVNHNVNSLTIYQRDERFRELYDLARYSFLDGMGVLAIARLEGSRLRSRNRIAVLDWIWPLLERAEREGWRVTHVGGKAATVEIARAAITQRHPRLELTMLDGYFDHAKDAEDNRSRLAEIKASAPQILLVGMGMPLQEHWILDNLGDLPHAVIITVGGIMGFLGNDRRTAPRWMGRLGVEWVFRVATEPRRLIKRYTIEPLALTPVLGRHLIDRFRGRPG